MAGVPQRTNDNAERNIVNYANLAISELADKFLIGKPPKKSFWSKLKFWEK